MLTSSPLCVVGFAGPGTHCLLVAGGVGEEVGRYRNKIHALRTNLGQPTWAGSLCLQ